MSVGGIASLPTNILAAACGYCDSRTLCAVARTCRVLSRCALQHLWHTLPSFAPLIYTLPTDAWMSMDTPVQGGIIRTLVRTQTSFLHLAITNRCGHCGSYYRLSFGSCFHRITTDSTCTPLWSRESFWTKTGMGQRGSHCVSHHVHGVY